MSRLHSSMSQTINGGESLLADVLEEITQAMEAGEPLDFDDYRRRYPELATELEQLIPAMDVLGKFGLSAVGASASEKSADDALAGQRELGDYCIQREIGRGGMGVVYEAEQLSLHRKVALKVLPFAAVMDERHLARFKNEAQIAAQLVHQHIVPVYSVGCERGVHYYAMQYIEGHSLAHVIRQLRDSDEDADSRIVDGNGAKDFADRLSPGRTDGLDHNLGARGRPSDGSDAATSPSLASATVPLAKLSTHQSTKSSAHFRGVARLGIQAAEALEHAHRNGVIHRDIKPANLLFDVKGDLWVTDFGLARIEAAPGLTLTGDVLGTLRYISPEQALAKRVVVDHRTDIYSLGVTLYELLTLRPAYDGRDRQELMRQIAFEEPRPPRRSNKAIPAELETIVLKAMEKNPADRYETAAALADDLARFLEDKPILAKRPSLARRLRKWSHRHRPLVASAIFVLLAGLLISTLVMAREREQALSQKREMEKQLRVATSLRLAAQSQSIQNELPIQSLLLAVEATEVTRRHGEGVLPLAQESLREALSAVGGRPLLGKDVPVNLRISPDGKRMATSSQGEVRLWDLTKPWASEVVLRGRDPKASVQAVSSDGRFIVTTEPNGMKVQLWDLTAADPLTMLGGNNGHVWNVRISPNGRWLVTAWQDATLSVYDLSLDDPASAAKILEGHERSNWTMAISPDSRWLATGTGMETGRARLWDLSADDPNATSLILPLREHETTVRSMAFSPDSRWLATGSGVYRANPDTAIKLWDLASNDPSASPIELPGDSTEVEVVKFSPDGRWLVSAGLDATAYLWDVTAAEGPRLKAYLKGHSDAIWDAAFAPDSLWLATASYDQTARVWSLTADDPSAVSLVLRGHEAKLGKVVFTPNSQWVVTASWDQAESRVWKVSQSLPTFDTSNGPKRKTVHVGTAPQILCGPASLHTMGLLDSSSKLFTTSHDGHVRIWDLTAANPARSSITYSASRLSARNQPYRTSLSRDGRWVAIASGDSAIDLLDLHEDDPASSTAILQNHAEGIPIIGFSPDSRWLVATTRDKRYRRTAVFSSNGAWLATDRTLRLWDLNSKDPPLLPRTLHVGEPGREGSAQHPLRVWNLNASNPAAGSLVLRGHQDEITIIEFSPHNRWLATGSADRTVRLWDMQSEDPNARPYVLHGHENAIANVVFRADGRWLVTSTTDIRLWDLADEGFWRRPLHLPGEHLLPWWQHPFSPDGNWLFTASKDNAIRLWNLTNPDPSDGTIVLRGHWAPPRWLEFSPDGRWLISVGGSRRSASDNTLRLWDLSAGNLDISSVTLRGPSKWGPEVTKFTSDSQRLIAGSRDGQIRIWDLQVERLIELARQTAGRELSEDERDTFMLP